MEQFTFLEAMFSSKSPDIGHILIWKLDSKKSAWFKTASEAAQSIQAGESNVYVSAGLQGSNLGPGRKGKQDTVIGIAGFSVDIDVRGPGHKQTDLPATFEEAHEILAKFPLKPSITVNTGGGLQAWWLFPKPWVFKDDAQRTAAIVLSQRLNYTFKSYTSHTIDSTFNLDRVMRVPGTINFKADRGPRPVVIEELGGVRYSVMDIDGACIKERDLPGSARTHQANQKPGNQKSASRKSSIVGKLAGKITGKERDSSKKLNHEDQARGGKVGGNDPLTLIAGARPSFLLFDALMDSDIKFEQTWRKQRDKTDDYPEGLGSPSEYDLALANFAANAGWPDQQIANLIIAWRTKHNENPDKGLRFDYMRRTIDIAKKKIELREADEIIRDSQAAGGFKVYTEEDRKLALQTFIKKTGINVIEYIKYVGRPPTFMWKFQVNGEKIEVPLSLIQNKTFREWKTIVWGQTNKFATQMKQNEWEGLLDVACAFMVEREVISEYDSQEKQVAAYLASYIERAEQMDKGTAVFREQPFEEDGNWYIHAETFMEWMKTNRRITEKRDYYINGFKYLNMTTKDFTVRLDGDRRHRNYWKVPNEIVSMPDNPENICEIDEVEKSVGRIIPMWDR